MLLFAAIAHISVCAIADELPGMVIQTNDGKSTSVDITSIRSIKYKDGVMLINKKDNNLQSVNVDDVSSITFGSITTAIESINGDKADSPIIVSDLTGKVVYKGTSKDASSLNLQKGTYIISSEGQKRKVFIK